MAEDWTTRQKSLDRLIVKYGVADDQQGYASTDHNTAWGSYSGISDGTTRFVVQKTLEAQKHLITLLRALINQENGYTPDTMLPYFLQEYTTDPDLVGGALDWTDIVAAWAEAPVTGRLFTILSIDSMRKQIWDEPVSSFDLAKGTDDWP